MGETVYEASCMRNIFRVLESRVTTAGISPTQSYIYSACYAALTGLVSLFLGWLYRVFLVERNYAAQSLNVILPARRLDAKSFLSKQAEGTVNEETE